MGPTTTAALLERERELALVARAVKDAHERRGGVVLMEADAGLGKTSLLTAAVELAAEAGLLCLRARASELERGFAYGCVRQLMDPFLANATDAEREDAFEGAASFARCLFVPSGKPTGVPSVDARFAMLHGLFWLCNNLTADRPVALFVDDLHWADAESLRFLTYLAARLDGLALTVFATTRPGEGDVQALARLAAAPETTVVRPRPLTLEATAALCERRLGVDVAPDFVAACREATGGNPFLLEELLREALERRISTDGREAARVRQIGPSAVARAVLLRLSGKPPAATELVHAVAVLGDGASLAEAARLAELSEEQAGEAADQLAALGILKPANGLEFAHAIVRAAVCRELGPIERARAHARAARILAAGGADEERVAAQIVAAEPAGDAEWVEVLRRVALGALHRGAPAAAVAWLRRALREPPPPERTVDVLSELGAAELRLGAPEAVDRLDAALERTEDPQALATTARQLALALAVSGESDRAVEVLKSASEAIERVDGEQALLLEAELASHAQQASVETRAPAAERLERRGGLTGATLGERLVLASLAYQRARASESADQAADLLEGALDGGRLLQDLQLDIAGPFYDLVVGLLATDSLDLVEACLDQALAEARATGSIPAAAFLTDRRGWLALRRGWVGRAEDDARTGLELLTCHGIPLGVPLALGVLVEALIELGELDAAENAVQTSGVGTGLRPGLTNNVLYEARALLLVAQGRTAEGFDALVEFGRLDEQWGGSNPLASRWRSHAALALATLGDAGEARAMAAEDLERARRWGAASGMGVALRARALVDTGDAQVTLLREAVEVLERSPARLEYARALTDLGAALRRGNRRADGRRVLGEGLKLAERLDARALAERARTELRAAGGRSSDPDGDGVAQLTASELRVAELAARGQSNPEIAQALFVTRKTVETHLGHVYQKLSIAGRGELHLALPGSGS